MFCLLLPATSSLLWCAGETGIKAKDGNRLNRLIRKAGSVVGSQLVTLEELVEQRMPSTLLVKKCQKRVRIIIYNINKKQ